MSALWLQLASPTVAPQLQPTGMSCHHSADNGVIFTFDYTSGRVQWYTPGIGWSAVAYFPPNTRVNAFSPVRNGITQFYDAGSSNLIYRCVAGSSTALPYPFPIYGLYTSGLLTYQGTYSFTPNPTPSNAFYYSPLRPNSVFYPFTQIANQGGILAEFSITSGQILSVIPISIDPPVYLFQNGCGINGQGAANNIAQSLFPQTIMYYNTTTQQFQNSITNYAVLNFVNSTSSTTYVATDPSRTAKLNNSPSFTTNTYNQKIGSACDMPYDATYGYPGLATRTYGPNFGGVQDIAASTLPGYTSPSGFGPPSSYMGPGCLVIPQINPSTPHNLLGLSYYLVNAAGILSLPIIVQTP